MPDLATKSTLHPERIARVIAKLEISRNRVDEALTTHIRNDNRTIAGICLLFSGGNDSTTLLHIFRDIAPHAVHANTGIGIEQTRQFVRDTCASWNLPLLEVHPGPGNTYEELVLTQGFPGPAHHWKMYQRLKERGLRVARRQLVKNPRRERVLFIAGRRRQESDRRKDIPAMEREGSVVWVSPLVDWTKEDLNTYRALWNVPRNEVSDLLHMSGECLCGAFAKAEELEEIEMWFPEAVDHIRQLEARVTANPAIDRQRCQWGWGAYRTGKEKVGPMCSSCDARTQPGT